MATYSILPGELNVTLRQGDNMSFEADFDIALTGYTLECFVYSTVDSSTVQDITASITSETDGTVQMALTSTQTETIPVGTYRWILKWGTSDAAQRTALQGIFEVRP